MRIPGVVFLLSGEEQLQVSAAWDKSEGPRALTDVLITRAVVEVPKVLDLVRRHEFNLDLSILSDLLQLAIDKRWAVLRETVSVKLLAQSPSEKKMEKTLKDLWEASADAPKPLPDLILLRQNGYPRSLAGDIRRFLERQGLEVLLQDHEVSIPPGDPILARLQRPILVQNDVRLPLEDPKDATRREVVSLGQVAKTVWAWRPEI